MSNRFAQFVHPFSYTSDLTLTLSPVRSTRASRLVWKTLTTIIEVFA